MTPLACAYAIVWQTRINTPTNRERFQEEEDGPRVERCDASRPTPARRPTRLGEDLAQRPPLDEAHGVVGAPLLVLAPFMDRDDGRMIELHRDPGLLHEAGELGHFDPPIRVGAVVSASASSPACDRGCGPGHATRHRSLHGRSRRVGYSGAIWGSRTSRGASEWCGEVRSGLRSDFKPEVHATPPMAQRVSAGFRPGNETQARQRRQERKRR